MTLCILGIDPGISGALAFYFTAAPDRVSVEDIPVADGMVDAVTVAQRITQIRPDVAVIEKVGAMPGQGVSSMFRFGQAFGTLQGVVSALGVPLHTVGPAKWKRHYGLDADKEAARALALRLFPSVEHFARKKDHGRAEAALIARYGAEVIIGRAAA